MAIVVDDGLATGATMIAALHALRARRPSRLICAVPVASREAVAKVRAYADDVVCLDTPEGFHAVGQFYRDFRQVDDAEVIAHLRAAGQADDRRPRLQPRAALTALLPVHAHDVFVLPVDDPERSLARVPDAFADPLRQVRVGRRHPHFVRVLLDRDDPVQRMLGLLVLFHVAGEMHERVAIVRACERPRA